MSSPLSIANAALIRLGAEPLESLDDPIDTARIARARLPDAVDAALRDHAWSCAVRRARLVRLAQESGRWAAAYQLPGDCLRALEIEPDAAPFAVEGRALLTNAAGPSLRYVARIGPELFDAQFADAAAAKLATQIAYRIAGMSRTAQLDAAAEYERLIAAARARDVAETRPRVSQGGFWLDGAR